MYRLIAATALFVPMAVVCSAASPPAPDINVARPPASFQTEKATKCVRSPVQFGSGGPGTVQLLDFMTTSDGWCPYTVWMKGHRPWDSATLASAPEHGEVFVTKSSNASILGYRAVHGYTGTDTFEIKWQPGDVLWRFSVTVGP
jgi:hypothetical protein